MLDAAANETERKLADIAVRRAKINLAEAKAVTNADLEKQVDQARLDFERIQETVDAGRLYAPYAGVVAGVSAAPGDPVEAYKPVLTVLDPANRELRVENVLSTDVAKLSTNQEVDVNFSRHEGQTVKGVIERLPGDPAQPGSGAQTDNSVHISFDPGELEVEIGDLAAVVVTLRKKENILYLPPQAIRTFQGRRFVVTEADGRQRRVDVELGIASGDQVEVIEGVTEGQVVIGQ
ncbi:MAG: HlyD family efflux transporter periplasmic adaptor subunit [Chloroflexia bacterium]